MSLPPVQITISDLTFAAELPTFFTQLAINAERDRIVTQILRANAQLNGEDLPPNHLAGVSQETNNYALLLATFTQTVQQPLPAGFSPDDFQVWGNTETEQFLMDYWRQLRAQQESFRKSRQGSAGEPTPAVGPVGGTP